VAVPAVPGVPEVSPPPVTPEILGLRLPSRSDSIVQARNTAGLSSSRADSPVVGRTQLVSK
jgi:hypothetical protein